MKISRIALIGNYDPSVRAHVAIPGALELASRRLECDAQSVWIETETIGPKCRELLEPFDAIWCVPASPYRSFEGALRAIEFSRVNSVPFLGTCGGFQHAMIEFARNVLGLAHADHAESNPEAELQLITPLSCSLVGAKGTIRLTPDSKIAAIYGETKVTEQYHCNFAFNREYRAWFQNSPLRISGVDEEGEVRVVEITNHPFYIATLFQPELSALENRIHPLMVAFVKAAGERHVQH